MKLQRSLALMAVLAAASSATATAQIQLRSGEYQVTVEMKLAGVSREDQQALSGIVNQTNLSRECKTAEQVGNAKTIARALAEEGEEFNCTMSDLKTTGDRMTFTSTCVEDGQRTTSNTENTFGPDSYATLATMKDSSGRTSTIKQMAKRIGECKK